MTAFPHVDLNRKPIGSVKLANVVSQDNSQENAHYGVRSYSCLHFAL